MESANSWRTLAAAVVAFFATALMFYSGNTLEPVWSLMWFAPLPVLWFALRGNWWSAALVSALALLAGCINLWSYFHLLHIPSAVWFASFGLQSLIFALTVLLFRALVLRGRHWTALFGFPASWVTFEFVRNLLWPHGTAGSIAYSQIGCLPFLQLASITGPWGMSFVLMLFPAGLAIAIHLRSTSRRQAVRVLGATAAIATAVFAFGAIRLAIPQAGPQVRVGLAALDRGVVASGAPTERLLDLYAPQVRDLAAQGAQAIVLPEKLGVMPDEDASREDAILQGIANQTRTTIVAGFDREMRGQARNQARIYRPWATVLAYDKEHLLPPVESKFTPGTERVLLSEPSARWGVAICKDMDFIGLARAYGRDGAGLMLVPAWDFNVDRAWHGHIAIMRAVEDGFSLARAAKNGYLTVADNRGRILAEARSSDASVATLAADVPVGRSWTLFLVLGNWFAWVCVAMTAWALVRLRR